MAAELEQTLKQRRGIQLDLERFLYDSHRQWQINVKMKK